MGGVWECQIQSARNILAILLKSHGHSVNDKRLRTLVAETEAIINSRPLTVESLSDVNSEIPLPPSNLLTPRKVMLSCHHQECSIDQTCIHVDNTSAAYCWRILVLLAKTILSESPSKTKIEYNQKKFPSWGCSIAKERHWEKQMTNGMNC